MAKGKKNHKTKARRSVRASEKKSAAKQDVMLGRACRRNYGDGKAK